MKELVSEDEVLRHTMEAVKARTPFSAIRLGDGEARLMGFPEFFSREELQPSLDNWFGLYRFSSTELKKMARLVRGACGTADVIGAPSQDRQKGDADCARFPQMFDHYAMAAKDVVWANCNFHRRLQERALFGPLLRAPKRLVLLTSRAGPYREKFPVSHVLLCKLGGERRRQGPRADLSPPGDWPEVFRKVQNKISTEVEPGDLVLVGGGPLGKVYCQWAKAQGAVALDIGSVFDGWAGSRSRRFHRTTGLDYSLEANL